MKSIMQIPMIKIYHHSLTRLSFYENYFNTHCQANEKCNENTYNLAK